MGFLCKSKLVILEIMKKKYGRETMNLRKPNSSPTCIGSTCSPA